MDEIISQASSASAEFVGSALINWCLGSSEEREWRLSVTFQPAVYKYTNDSDSSFQICRKSCIMKLNAHCFTKNGQTPLNVFAILDYLLDKEFTELEIRIPYHIIKIATLLSIIAHRSPKVERLEITLCTISSISPQLEYPALKNPLEQSNSSLKSLTKLSIYHCHTECLESLLAVEISLTSPSLVSLLTVVRCWPIYEAMVFVSALSETYLNCSLRITWFINSIRLTTLYGATMVS